MLEALDAYGEAYDTVAYNAAETVFFALSQELGEEVFFGHKAIERELLVIEDLDAAAAKLELSAEELLGQATRLRRPLRGIGLSAAYRRISARLQFVSGLSVL